MSDEVPGADRIIRDLHIRIEGLEAKLHALEARHEDVKRALYGYPELGQQGFRDEMDRQIQELRAELRETRNLCEDLQRDRQEELAERRGKDKFIARSLGFTGITSLATLISIIGLVITIWKSGIFGG